ncbi:hypothetical protein HNQ09_000604 [Deinococcus budaensis]|uniref:Uncharacterized protein n=1 Tax=Deinococcus budaensis TaxID=1665626 RepID=A0A7W8GCV1_9DEIO|nr:hypothetical protein [Deinococcus budaensis]
MTALFRSLWLGIVAVCSSWLPRRDKATATRQVSPQADALPVLAQSHPPQITSPPRQPDDRLRRRASDEQSRVLAERLLSLRGDWTHVVVAVAGIDDNPYNPATIDEVRAFIAHLLPATPAVIKLERSTRLRAGGLHLHLIVPASSPPTQRTRWEFVTGDGVIIRARRQGCTRIRAGAADLSRLIAYLHKPSHAGAKWFRPRGEQHPHYLAAVDALQTGLGMCRERGLQGLRRTLWTQHLPRCPPQVPVPAPPPELLSPAASERKSPSPVVHERESRIPGRTTLLSPVLLPQPGEAGRQPATWGDGTDLPERTPPCQGSTARVAPLLPRRRPIWLRPVLIMLLTTCLLLLTA